MGFLDSLFGGSSSTSVSQPVRMPRTKEGQVLLDALMQSLRPEEIATMSTAYQTGMKKYIGDVEALKEQISKPAYTLGVGKWKMPIAPLGAIKTQAALVGGQAELEQNLFNTYMDKLYDIAKSLELGRTGQQTTATQKEGGGLIDLITGLSGAIDLGKKVAAFF